MRSKNKLSIEKIGKEMQFSDGSRGVPLRDFSFLQKRKPVVFPSNLKHLDVDEKRGIGVAVFEIPAGVHSVPWDNHDYDTGIDKKEIFKISLPYIVLAIGFDMYRDRYYIVSESIGCWFSNKRLRSLNEKLCFPHLRNCMNRRGVPWVCLGIEGHPAHKELGEFLRQAYHECFSKLFGAVFNNDLRSLFEAGSVRDRRVKTIEQWQKSTLKNPDFATSVKWRQCEMTLAKSLDKIKANILEDADYCDYDDFDATSFDFNAAANVIFERGDSVK